MVQNTAVVPFKKAKLLHQRQKKQNFCFAQVQPKLSLIAVLIEGTEISGRGRFAPSKILERAAPATAFWAAILTAGEVGTLG